MDGRLGADLRGIHRPSVFADEVFVESVFVKSAIASRLIPEPGSVGFILAEEPFGRAVRVKSMPPEIRVLHLDVSLCGAQLRFGGAFLPSPGVAEPELRQHVQQHLVGAAIADGDLEQKIVRRCLGVFHKHVVIAIVVKDAGVEQLKLRLTPPPTAVLAHKPSVGELPLRVFVEHLQIGMRGCRIEVVIQLLDVLAVVALRIGQPEEALFEDRVAAIPQHQREAQPLQLIAEARNAVLSPAEGPAASCVVGDVIPGIPVGAVVLPNRSPLAFAQIRSPTIPIFHPQPLRGQPLFFLRHPLRYRCFQPHGPSGSGFAVASVPPQDSRSLQNLPLNARTHRYPRV